jgi:hypothetical protein
MTHTPVTFRLAQALLAIAATTASVLIVQFAMVAG